MARKKQLPNSWEELMPIDGSYTFPQALQDWLVEKDALRSFRPGFCHIYYKGDPTSTKEWIAVTDDGSYYKVDAQYMVWSNTSILAAWSTSSMKRVVKAIQSNTVPERDPLYQT